MLEIHTFGGLQLSINGVKLTDLGSRKAEAILVYMAVVGSPQKRNVLATLLWPESSEAQALISLRVAIASLRKYLDAYLDITRDALGLRPDASIYFDVVELNTQLLSGQIERALEIYRGDFLQGFKLVNSQEFENWRRLQQEYYHWEIAAALHTSISTAIEESQYKKGLEFVYHLLALDPVDEFAHRQCMFLLALDHQRTAALAQYEKSRRLLLAELGIEPSPETHELYEQILLGLPPFRTGYHIPPNNLPIFQANLIGREHELESIAAILQDPDCHLLTLLGPGGIGKTHLAIQVARKTIYCFSDGIYFVPADQIASPENIFPEIASVLYFTLGRLSLDQFGHWSELLDYLRYRSLLLILDGFEHLVAGAGFLNEVATYAPHTKILVTSRKKLNLQDEWVFPLERLHIR